MEDKMPTVLFIHGLNSDVHSSTGQVVRSILNEHNIKLLIPAFDVLNPDRTIQKINSLIKKNHISMIIGHSLGGFYTLVCFNGPMKVYINPCLCPADILPSLIPVIAPEILHLFCRLTDKALCTIDREVRVTSYGIFSKDDTLFSFYGLFHQYFGDRCRYINGGHKPSKEDLSDAFSFALQCINKDVRHFVKEDTVTQ